MTPDIDLPRTASVMCHFMAPELPRYQPLRTNPNFVVWCNDSSMMLTFNDAEAARAFFAAGLAALEVSA